MRVKLSVSGVKEIDSVLSSWPKDLQHKTLSATHSAAAKPMIEKAKLLAPEGPEGNLVDSIGSVTTPMAKANIIGEVKIGPRRSRRYRGHHGHLVEFGTKPRRNRRGANRGIMPKKPFMEPAFHATKNVVVNSIALQLGKKMFATMKRYIKR